MEIREAVGVRGVAFLLSNSSLSRAVNHFFPRVFCINDSVRNIEKMLQRVIGARTRIQAEIARGDRPNQKS